MARVGIIGDTHCPGMLKGYPAFLSRTFKRHKVNRVVHIGDLVDWHAINFHGKHSETPGVLEEVKLARRQITQLTSRFPNVDWLLGNHDALPARRADDAGLPGDILKSENEYWNLPKGWKVHQRYDAVEIDGVLIHHGEVGSQGKFACLNQAVENMQSTAIGHLHGNAGAMFKCSRNNRIFGLSVGCGVDHKQLQFEYGRKYPRKPMIGCGIILEGEVPIFEPMKL